MPVVHPGTAARRASGSGDFLRLHLFSLLLLLFRFLFRFLFLRFLFLLLVRLLPPYPPCSPRSRP